MKKKTPHDIIVPAGNGQAGRVSVSIGAIFTTTLFKHFLLIRACNLNTKIGKSAIIKVKMD